MQTCGVMEVDGDLPRRIQTSSGGVLVNYCYLSDGSKAEALKADGTGLVYRGSLIYRKAADGALTLESVQIPGGRLTPGGVRYHVTDHLGSVVAVVDGSSGAVYQASEYAPYGERTDNAAVTVSPAPAGETFRDQFTGKEDQGPDYAVPYTDFSARHYSPALSRWLTPDPSSEKYYDVSPYAYCDGNPVMLVDEDGRVPRVYITKKGVGHAFITTGEGEKTTVYTYGRYGTNYKLSGLNLGQLSPAGEGCLAILKNEDALKYLSDSVYSEGNYSIFVFPNIEDSQMDAYFSKLFDTSEKRPSNPLKKTYNNDNYRVIDDYNLFFNNCVITTMKALQSVIPYIFSPSFIPLRFDTSLYIQSLFSNNIEMVNNPADFLSQLIEELQKDENL